MTRLRVPVLGHALFDRQHQRIAALGRQLLVAAARGRGLRELGILLRATTRHFDSEERIMAAIGYRDQAGHRVLHDGIIADMVAVRAHLRAGLPLHRKHADRIIAWLGHHADGADRNLVAAIIAARR